MWLAETRRTSIMDDPNQVIAMQVLDLAEVYRPTPRYWGYKQASRAIRRYPQFITDLTDARTLWRITVKDTGPTL